MSDTSPNLKLPYLLPSQAQKHVTHNEALKRLDQIVHLRAETTALTTPPAAPVEGDRHIVGSGGQGDWSGHDMEIATWEAGAWSFVSPSEGWLCWSTTDDTLRVFDGNTWISYAPEIPETVAQLGIATTADSNHPLSVAGPGMLLSHDGSDHRLTINKANASDTASIVLQSGWSGHAELGLCGDNDFTIKVSDNGSSFVPAIQIARDTGIVSFPQGVSDLVPQDFGGGSLVNTDYIGARGLDLVTNGLGGLGNGYNFPASFAFDPLVTPNLPGSVSYAGHFSTIATMDEHLAINPNEVYRLSAMLMQEGLTGDFSAFANEERHAQYMGLLTYDADGNQIFAPHHMRYRHGATDSMTTLVAPLSPGDTVISVTDASGWNESSAQSYDRGVIIFGYKSQAGYAYEHYSRIVTQDLFALGGVDKITHTITLSQPLPASMGNPDDPNGTWPVGTALANSSSGSSYKYAFFSGLIVDETDKWYRCVNHIGGVDRSGKNVAANFPPGTASVRVFWFPNYSNRSGGWTTYPDTGAAHKVWFAGVSVRPSDMSRLAPSVTAGFEGSYAVEVPTAAPGTGALSLANASLEVLAVT